MPSGDTYEVTAQVDSDALKLITSGDKLSATTAGPSHQIRLQVKCKTGTCSVGGKSSAFGFQGMEFEIPSLTGAYALLSDIERVIQSPLIPPLSSESSVNATIDDPSKGINYQGFAPAVTSSKGNPIVNDAIVGSSQGKTLSYTATKSANATIYFTGKFELQTFVSALIIS